MPLSSFPDLQVVIQALNSSTEFYVAFSGNLLTVTNFFFITMFFLYYYVFFITIYYFPGL